MMEIHEMKSEISTWNQKERASLKRKQEALKFAYPILQNISRLLDLSNNDMESECLTSENTSRIETSPEKQPHINTSKSGKCRSLILLKPVKENHKLPVRQISRKERSPDSEKSKTPVRVQENPVRKSIFTSTNQ